MVFLRSFIYPIKQKIFAASGKRIFGLYSSNVTIHCDIVMKKLRMNDIQKSANDKRDYRLIKLDNGLRCLLVSDTLPGDQDTAAVAESDGSSDEAVSEGESSTEETEDGDYVGHVCGDEVEAMIGGEKKAAAALCVGVGSFSDPPDIPGLAHFLEHMVFMGSEKYPKENDFDDYLGRHGGESNAWTDCEKTLFYFDVERTHLRKALDKFAQFFISPLMLQDSVDREIQAVESEFQLSLSDDVERANKILSNLAKEGHPMRKFLPGNLQSLKTDPEKSDINIYERLKSFYDRMYSAQYMTLVLDAPEELDTLEDIVRSSFSDVKNNCLPCPNFSDLKNPFDTQDFNKLYRVIPVENVHRLDITWAFSPLHKYYRVKPLDYLATLIQHEGKGSILHYLKQRLWALSLSGGSGYGGFEYNATWTGFCINISLTDQGFEHMEDVLSSVFGYIHMLQQGSPQRWIYKEQQAIADAKFRWQEHGKPMSYVEFVSENMQLFPAEDCLSGRELLYEYDEELIKKCTDHLRADNANFILLSKQHEKDGICDKVEPWYKTKYCVAEIDADLMEKLKEPVFDSSVFHLPEKNKFIATDFSLRNNSTSEPTKHPHLILDNALCKFWYKKDSIFNVPKGFVYLHVITPKIRDTVESTTMTDLLINLLHHKMDEALYPAILAEYTYSVEFQETGLLIEVDGFSHKLPDVVLHLLDHLVEFSCTDELFETIKAQQKKAYYNDVIKPEELASMMRHALTSPFAWSVPERLACLDFITPAQLKAFVQKLKEELFIEGFIIGNFSDKEAESFGIDIMSRLTSSQSLNDTPQLLCLEIPQGEKLCKVHSFNNEDSNSCVIQYCQMGPATIHDTCLNEVLAMRMKEPCFDTLRTKKQLGYAVFSQSVLTGGILGLMVTVECQATKFSMEEIHQHIQQFLNEFDVLLQKMTQEEFEEEISTIITIKKCEDTNMGEEAGRTWREILDQYYVFNRREREIDILKTLTLQFLQDWYHRYLGENQRRLCIQVVGNSNSTSEQSNNIMTASGDNDLKATAFKFATVSKSNSEYIVDIPAFKKSLKMFPVTKVTS